MGAGQSHAELDAIANGRRLESEQHEREFRASLQNSRREQQESESQRNNARLETDAAENRRILMFQLLCEAENRERVERERQAVVAELLEKNKLAEERAELQRAFSAQQQQTQKELENAVNEGKRNIGRLENEKKEIEQKRENELRKYENDLKEMVEEHERAFEQHKTTETNLKKQSIEQKMSQMEKETRLHAQRLNSQVAALEKERERTSTVAILKEFLSVMQTSHEAMESLGMVKVFCIDSSPTSHQAGINFELDNLRNLRKRFHDQFQKFSHFLLNEPKANRDLVDSCMDCIKQVELSMNDDIMRHICGNLPSALENGNVLRINSFGEDAGFLATKLKFIKEKTSELLTVYTKLANLPSIDPKTNLTFVTT